MSDIFEIDDGKKYALSRLENHPDLDLCTKLQLCHKFNLESWLEPAFRELMCRDVQDVTHIEAETLPMRVFFTFAQVKNDIINHRLGLAYSAPPIIIAADCSSACKCTIGWELAWKEGPASLLHHPDLQFSDKDILRQLESASFPEASEVCEGCYQLSVQNINVLGALEGEQRILEHAIEELKMWLVGS
jgi:hypothetical protein